MRTFLKPFIITLTLLLPAAIYLFLRFFGDNQFDIPIYYESGISEDSIRCSDNSVPHRVDLSKIITGEISKANDITLRLIDVNTSLEAAKDKRLILQRIFDLTDEKGVELIQIIGQSFTEENGLNDMPWFIEFTSTAKLVEFAQCQLILLDHMEESHLLDRIVLVDEKGRIRGYYELNNFEEIDRLLVEIKILFQQTRLENG